MEMVTWGGSGIEKSVYEWFVANVPAGEVVVELGAGDVSTVALSARYNLYSVEDDQEWVGKHDSTKYIYAPIKEGWYDVSVLCARLPDTAYAVLVDGPVGKRGGVLKNLAVVSVMRPKFIVFHDTNRLEEALIASAVARRMGMCIKYYSDKRLREYWAVAYDTSIR